MKQHDNLRNLNFYYENPKIIIVGQAIILCPCHSESLIELKKHKCTTKLDRITTQGENFRD